MTYAAPNWEALQRVIDGDVVLPGASAYDEVRKPMIARFDHVRPQAVVQCTTPADVAETLAFARRSALPMAIRSGGHSFAGYSTTQGVVIDVTPLRSVSISDGKATVGAGARLGDVYDAMSTRGLTVPGGCGPTVGIAGLTLGGGLGILGRAHGLTADHLLSAEIVLADGRVIACDDNHDGDLFWALRGAGGGNFGVVTSLVFATLPEPTATSFHLVWPHADAATVIDRWQRWAPAAPDRLAASLLLTASDEIGQPLEVNVFGAMVGTDSDTRELLGEFVARVGIDPVSTSTTHTSYRETKRYLADLGAMMAGERVVGEPSGQQSPRHPFSKSEFFRQPLPTDVIAALVEHVSRGRVPGQYRELDFTPWGGAYNRVPADATAFVHRDARFLLKHTVAIVPDTSSEMQDDARRWLTRSWALAHPWGTGGVYPNFPDPDLADWAHAYYGANYDRLVRVKARYDPDNVFRFPQSLPSHIVRPANPVARP